MRSLHHPSHASLIWQLEIDIYKDWSPGCKPHPPLSLLLKFEATAALVVALLVALWRWCRYGSGGNIARHCGACCGACCDGWREWWSDRGRCFVIDAETALVSHMPLRKPLHASPRLFSRLPSAAPRRPSRLPPVPVPSLQA